MFLIEAVPEYSASALAAHTVASSVGGSLIPLATFSIYEKIGYGWGNTAIAAVNLGLCLIPATMLLISRKAPEKWKSEVVIGQAAS